MFIPDFLIPVTIVAGMAMVLGLYLKFSLYRESKAAKHTPPSRSNDVAARD